MNLSREKKTERNTHERKKKQVPELFQVVIECRDEGEQRELFERMRREGRRMRLLVL